MRYVSFGQTLSGLMAFFLCGLCGGIVFGETKTIDAAFRFLWKFPFLLWKSCLFLWKEIKESLPLGHSNEKASVCLSIWEGLATFATGIAFLLLTYIFLDGIFRFYALSLFFFGFYLSWRRLVPFLSRLSGDVLKKAQFLLLWICAFFLHPYVQLLRFFFKLVLFPIWKSLAGTIIRKKAQMFFHKQEKLLLYCFKSKQNKEKVRKLFQNGK